MSRLKIKFSLLVLLLTGFLPFATNTINAQDTDYIIKKGDVLTIAVMGHPEFSLERIIVLPDGFIQFPGLGSIQASGMSVKSFTKLVTDNVSKFVLNPIVTVFIYALPSQVINVIGYVNRPGQIPIFEKISVMDAISRAGGIKFIKKAKKIIVIRADQSYEEISVKNIYSNDTEKRTIKLLDIGDTVYVVEPKEINWSQLSFFTTLGYVIISLINILN